MNEEKIHSSLDFIPLKKSKYCFIASKKFVKDNKIKTFKDIANLSSIVPKTATSRRKLFEEYCKKENIELKNTYEVASSSIVKKLVLNDLGVGFIDSRSIEDIKDKIEIIKEIEFKDQIEGIATLNKKMCNKATLELVKYIKKYNEEK